MNPNYKQDENAIRIIICQYVVVIDFNKCHRFIIYYNNFKTFNLIFRNNSSFQKTTLCKNNFHL